MKLLVEVTGSFMLVDPNTRDVIDPARPSVVRSSNFIQARTALGQIRVLENELLDTATDEEFAKFWKSSGQKELAVDSFLSKFKVGSQVEDEAPVEAPVEDPVETPVEAPAPVKSAKTHKAK